MLNLNNYKTQGNQLIMIETSLQLSQFVSLAENLQILWKEINPSSNYHHNEK